MGLPYDITIRFTLENTGEEIFRCGGLAATISEGMEISLNGVDYKVEDTKLKIASETNNIPIGNPYTVIKMVELEVALSTL